MEVRYIYFDNDLDIAPGPNESFTYKPGSRFIMHWDTSTPQRTLLRMYNVHYIREIDFAPNLPVPHSNQTTDQGSIPISRPNTYDPVVTSPAEPWHPECIDDNVPQDRNPDTDGSNTQQDFTLDSSPPLPKLNEMCICEDAPDPTCPIHRNHST